MQRPKLRMQFGMVLLFASLASLAPLQQNEAQGMMNNAAKNGAIADNRLMDVNTIGVSDPSQVDVLFREGDSILSILRELKDKGFHIQYREKQFSEDMILLELPTATDIDSMLKEILEPWHFTTYRTPMGKVVVTPVKQKKKRSSAGADGTEQGEKADG